jgi:hypothetical protein
MAVLSIDITTDTVRIQAAYGALLNLPGPATAAQVKAAVIDQMKAVVRNYEYTVAQAAVSVGTINPT